MTIKEMADAFIGHPREINESVTTTAFRDAYKRGAEDMLNKARNWMFERDLNGESIEWDAFEKAMEE